MLRLLHLTGWLFLLLPTFTFAQAGTIKSHKLYGGTGEEYVYSTSPTPDGGVFVAGITESGSGDVTGPVRGTRDIWITRLNKQGDIVWQRRMGGSYWEIVFTVKTTSDGGCIFAAETESNDGDIVGSHGAIDYWIVKMAGNGDVEWAKCLGGTGNDYPTNIAETADLGYIVAGKSNSLTGDVTGNHGDYDAWVVKLAQNGSIQWERSLGGANEDFAYQVTVEADGYIVAGGSQSFDGDLTTNQGYMDCWLFKLDLSGALVWQRTFGGSDYDDIKAICKTPDGGWVMACHSASFDGDVAINYGSFDIWLVKLKSDLTIEWQKTYGGSGEDYVWSLNKTADGGFVMGGVAYSPDGDMVGYRGNGDGWVMKVNSQGEKLLAKSMGGSGTDLFGNIYENSDGSFSVFGFTRSSDGDILGVPRKGGADLWLLQLEGFSLLPLQFLDFKAGMQGGDAVLTWRIDEATSAGHFSVLRSVDGMHFKQIGQVAMQQAGYPLSYSYKDRQWPVGKKHVYYSIVIHDGGGEKNRSAIVHLTLPVSRVKLSLISNPVGQSLEAWYDVPGDENALITITTTAGHAVYKKSSLFRKGMNKVSIPVTNWPAGAYILTVVGTERQSVKFVKR